MKKLVILFFLLTSTICYSQSDTCFTQNQIINIFEKIQKLHLDDSLKTELIKEYEIEIQQHENLHRQDSLIVEYQKQEITLLHESVDLHLKLYKTVRPRWYDSKGVWFLTGASMIFASSWVVKNVK